MIEVRTAHSIDSPAVDLGLNEMEVRETMERHYQSLRDGKTIDDQR